MASESSIPLDQREAVLVNVVGLLVEVSGALSAIVGQLRAQINPDFDDKLRDIEKDLDYARERLLETWPSP